MAKGTCRAIKSDGTQCQMVTNIEDGLCVFHDPERLAEFRKRKNEDLKRPTRIQSIEDIQQGRMWVWMRLSFGKMSESEAKTFMSVLDAQEKSITAGLSDDVKRLTKLVEAAKKS